MMPDCYRSCTSAWVVQGTAEVRCFEEGNQLLLVRPFFAACILFPRLFTELTAQDANVVHNGARSVAQRFHRERCNEKTLDVTRRRFAYVGTAAKRCVRYKYIRSGLVSALASDTAPERLQQ